MNARESKQVAAELLSFEKYKIILKWYWKLENLWEIERERRREFAREPVPATRYQLHAATIRLSG